MLPKLFLGPQPRIFYGWVIVGLSMINLAVAFGVWYSFSVFFLAIIGDFGWSRAEASSIFSLFIICQSLSSPLTGRLLDRFGPRLVMPLGGALLATALFLVSFAQSLWFFQLVYGGLAGVTVSLMGFTTNSAMLSRWFERYRGAAAGVAMAGIGLGMIVLVPLAEHWIAAWGWRTAYVGLAGVVAGVIIPLNLLLAKPGPWVLDQTSDGGERPPKPGRKKPAREMRILDPAWCEQQWTLRAAVRTPRFWILMASYCFCSLCFQGTLMHTASAMVDAGLTLELSAIFMGLMGVFSSTGKVFFGILSDRLGRELTFLAAVVVCTLGLVAAMLMPFHQVGMALAMAVLFGLGYGGITPLYPATAADLFMGGSFGLVFSLIFLGSGVGGSVGPLLSGLLRDLTGTYFYAFCLALASIWVACLLLVKSGPGKVRRVRRVKSSTAGSA